MNTRDSVELDAAERNELLGSQGTGVISIATNAEKPPHTVPVSYGYDPETSVFYYRLATGTDSEKGELAGRHVSFVVYDHVEGVWRSVVARGRLESTTDEEVATEALAGMEGIRIPLVDVFGRPSVEVQFEFYRLVPDELTGRTESSTAP